MTTPKISYIKDKVANVDLFEVYGKVLNVSGLSIEALTPASFVGELCSVNRFDGKPMFAEVVGFKEGKTLLMPIGDVQGIGPNSLIRAMGRPLWIKVSDGLVGRVVNAIGEPLDDKGPVYGEKRSVYQDPPHPLKRKIITEPCKPVSKP